VLFEESVGLDDESEESTTLSAEDDEVALSAGGRPGMMPSMSLAPLGNTTVAWGSNPYSRNA